MNWHLIAAGTGALVTGIFSALKYRKYYARKAEAKKTAAAVNVCAKVWVENVDKVPHNDPKLELLDIFFGYTMTATGTNNLEDFLFEELDEFTDKPGTVRFFGGVLAAYLTKKFLSEQLKEELILA